MSSTWRRELTAVVFALESFLPLTLNGFLTVKMLVELSKLEA